MLRPIALLLAALALGCGPVLATSVVDDAEAALARAHGAEGEKYATYETTLADLYLVKAREEQGNAHYSDAHELAEEALRYAQAATRKAAERRATSTEPPVPQATVQHGEASAPPPPPPPERKPKAPIDPGNLP